MSPPSAEHGAPAAVLDISLLGPFAVRDAGGRAIEIAGQKDRALLAFLAASPGTVHPREKLAGLLWGDSGDRQARDSLKQAVLRLRRSLAAASAALVADRSEVGLAPGAAVVDLAQFEQRLRDGTPEAVEAALALYRGELLEGLHVRSAGFEEWLLVERQRLARMAVEALAASMAQARAAGARERAADAAQRLLLLDPLHEAACRTLMSIHAERGERPQALKLFEALKQRLQEQLGVAPEPETAELHDQIRAPEPAGAAATTGPLPKPSVGVLPFVNISGEAEQDFFADGLTEDIITDLSQVSGLFVAARHAAFALKDRGVPEQEAARALGVGCILHGSVQKDRGRVRVTAQLVDGASGGQLWADRFDRPFDDIFALQDEISKAIVDVLRVKLLPEELGAIGTRSTASASAYEFYLTGRAFYLRGIHRRDLRIARDFFAKAVEIDPRYARAYAGMAICDSYLSTNGPESTLEGILANSAKALALAPGLAEAYAARGLALYHYGRYDRAAAEFARAIALDRNLYEASFFYARNCRLQGLHEQAVPLYERAAALRPNDFRAPALLVESLRSLGRHDDAVAAARRCLNRLEAEVRAHPDNADALAVGSSILSELGQAARAEDWAARALIIGPDDPLVHYNLARSFAMLGDAGRALDRLEETLRGSPVFRRRIAAWLRRDEAIRPLGGHARYRSFVQRLEAGLDPIAGDETVGSAPVTRL